MLASYCRGMLILWNACGLASLHAPERTLVAISSSAGVSKVRAMLSMGRLLSRMGASRRLNLSQLRKEDGNPAGSKQ